MLSDVVEDVPCELLPHSDSLPRPVDNGIVAATGFHRCLQKRGPLLLAFMHASPDGRWRAVLGGKSQAAKDSTRMLEKALASKRRSLMDEAGQSGLAGVCLMRGWRYSLERSSDMCFWALKRAAAEEYKRCQQPGFLEHDVVAACVFAPGHAPAVQSSWLLLPAESGGGHIEQALPAQCLTQETFSRGFPMLAGVRPLSEVLDKWALEHGPRDGQSVIWPVWSPMAIAMSLGVWPGDVSFLMRRCRGHDVKAPIQPPPMDVALYLKPEFKELRASALAIDEEVQPEDIGCHERKYSAEDMILAVSATKTLTNLSKADASADAWLEFWHREQVKDVRDRLISCGRRIPSPSQLQRARPRLDIASMLARREEYEERGATYRYIAYDASPQRPGLEIFGQLERVVWRSELSDALSAGQSPPLEIRRMPVSVLGQGRCALVDKVQCVVHQTWLDYGPSTFQVRCANLDVRQCLSGQGVELGIGDYADVVDECLGQSDDEDVLRGKMRYLFPLALVVPGSQHIIDGALREGIQCCHWWPQWQADSKVLCQWLHSRSHRDLLAQFIRERRLDPVFEAACLKRLTFSVERFAQWRWKTLDKVTSQLHKIRHVLQTAFEVVTAPGQLAQRDTSEARKVMEVVNDGQFWARLQALRVILQPLMTFSGWVRGCKCHEKELLAGKTVQCVWKGCRAKELSQRVQKLKNDLSAARGRPVLQLGLELGDQTRIALTRILSTLALKFEWVDEPPYSVWRVDGPEEASRFLAQHDRQVASGQVVHRVTHYLAGQSPLTLRAQMEEFARSGVLGHDLAQEIAAYSMCMLDDTSIEAYHRDMGHFSLRAKAATLWFRASSVRLGQNLKPYESKGARARLRLRRGYLRYKSICNKGRPRKNRKVPWRYHVTPAKVFASVYRLGQSSLRDWGHLSKVMDVLLPPEPSLRLRASTKLKLDYLEAVCSQGGTYSFPTLVEDRMGGERDMQVAEAASMLERGCETPLFFTIVDTEVRRKKLLKVGSQVEMKMMSRPVSVQYLATWGVASYPCESVDVYSDGYPHVVDLLRFAPWPVLRACLRSWETAPSDVEGCLRLCNGQLESQRRWSLDDPRVPAVIVLEELADRGWELGSPPLVHTLDTALVYKCPHALKWKPYFQCLLLLAEFRDRTGSSSLPSDQVPEYYSCVLAAKSQALVPLGQSAKFYLDWGEDRAKGPIPLALEAGQLQSDEDVPMGDPRDPRVAATLQRERGISLKASFVDAPESPGGSALWRALPKAARRHASSPSASQRASKRLRVDEPQLHQRERSVMQSSPMVSSGLPTDDGDVPAAVAPEPAPAEVDKRRRRRPRPVLDRLEGVDVLEDSFGVKGKRRSYTRLMVDCPLKGSLHPGCSKRRNVGPKQTKKYGPKEPFGFIGAWLQAANDFDNAKEHIKHKPKSTVIKAYMESQGWL